MNAKEIGELNKRAGCHASAGAQATRALYEVVRIDGTFTIKDVFTTCNGSWEVVADNDTGSVFAIPSWAQAAYATPDFAEAGGAHHLFVRVQNEDTSPVWGAEITITPGDLSSIRQVLDRGRSSNGWINVPMFNFFDPSKGPHGGWRVQVTGGREEFFGGGLPLSHHVSTFVVFERAAQFGPPPDKPPMDAEIVTVGPLKAKTIIVLSNPAGWPFEVRVPGK